MHPVVCKARSSLPSWILAWFTITAMVCTWDAFFILLRPHTFPGGKYNAVWYPYRHYINIDQRYRDVSDGFVVAVSLMNCAEVICNLATLLLHKQGSRHTVPLGFTVSVMTFWKTIMYFLMLAEICGGHNFRKGNGFWQEIIIIAIPNGIWIVVPFVVMAALWNKMMTRGDDNEANPVWKGSSWNGSFLSYTDQLTSEHHNGKATKIH